MGKLRLAIVELTASDRAELESLASRRKTAQALALRARIVLGCAHFHYTPTSASWINQVERFFALLTERQIRRGVHRNLDALHSAISSFIDQHNADPKPFRWTKSADDILASIERFCVRNIPERTSGSGH